MNVWIIPTSKRWEFRGASVLAIAASTPRSTSMLRSFGNVTDNSLTVSSTPAAGPFFLPELLRPHMSGGKW